MTKKYLSGKWKLYNENYAVNACVPGDISDDLLKAGIIEDPYYGDNADNCLWIVKSDWVYEKEFVFGGEESDEIFLCFDGVDTFAEVYLNGVAIGETSNMHRLYEFEATNVINRGNNLLRVKMRNVFDKFGKNGEKKYNSIFNDDRVFIRKAQCHFGWDWAPKLPGYGIYRDVYVKSRKKGELSEVTVNADIGGAVTFRLNFKEKFEGETIIIVSLNGEEKARVAEKTCGKRKLLNVFVKDPELWFPNGYGEQPLYDYSIVQKKDGEVYSRTDGKLAFRKAELEQISVNSTRNSFAIKINGRKIFAKGSNWVPADCMTGRITDEKYKFLITAAKDAGFNILRVWGGGIYEKDCFYNLCDEAGILVWQDFMFACSDIPDDDFGFVKEITAEAECQVKRLCGHPCVALFCGENEVSGSFTPEVDEKYSVFALHYLLRGVCGDIAPNIPYIRCSPFAFADTENDVCEGDGHNNLSEICLFSSSFKGFDAAEYSVTDDKEVLALKVKNYETFVEETKCNFSSECAVMGAANYSSLLKFAPKEEIILDSDFFRKRFLGNPYTYVMPNFFDRQKAIAEAAFGKISDVEDLFKKVNKMQSDIMKTEILYARCNGESSGFMNWMYNDVWPTGTWSVIDYFLSKKPAYYQMKRCFVQRGALLLRVGNDYYVVVLNDKPENVALDVKVKFCDYFGKEFYGYNVKEKISAFYSGLIKISMPKDKRSYMQIEGKIGETNVLDTYDFERYSGRAFDAVFDTETALREEGVVLKIKAKTFVPYVTINGGNPEDNFFDMAAGEERKVFVETSCPEKVSVKTFYDDESE